MSSLELRGPPVRGYRRRKAVLDLNALPNEAREHEGPSRQAAPEVSTSQPIQPAPPVTIDVEEIDDDVVESSATAFAEAKNNSRRSRRRAVSVNLDSGRLPRSANNSRRRRHPPSETVINCDHYINLESTLQPSVVEVATKSQPLLKEPTFNCPICMGPLVEEMSTRCGHIFCKACIKAALAVQAKCPTCRKRVTVKELIRVFLPSAT